MMTRLGDGEKRIALRNFMMTRSSRATMLQYHKDRIIEDEKSQSDDDEITSDDETVS